MNLLVLPEPEISLVIVLDVFLSVQSRAKLRIGIGLSIKRLVGLSDRL